MSRAVTNYERFSLDEVREHPTRLVLRDEWTWFVSMWAILGLQVTERELDGGE